MRKDAIQLEEKRLESINEITEYGAVHERHRIFPDLFENRKHKNILDISAGVGVVASRIKQNYEFEKLLCNDISPKCLKILEDQGLETISFDIDDDEKKYPLDSNSFDAVISLATIEHLMNIDHYLGEINRILKPGGNFYVSAPNYSGLTYLLPFLISGRTFHNPLNKADHYEFFAHVKYFTYRTLLEYISTKGFSAEAVYLGIPKESTKFLQLKKTSPLKAMTFKNIMNFVYRFSSPRWAAEPVICFKKDLTGQFKEPRKVIL